MSDTTWVCPRNPFGHDWQAGLACRCGATRTAAEAIVSVLAGVRGWSVEAAAAVRDAHRAEVLADDGQAYDGHLSMLRDLVRTLHVVVNDGGGAEKQRAEVRRLLDQYTADDTAARAEADTGPGFSQPGRTYQRAHHGQPVTFHVTAVSTSPDGRRTVAHGWRTDPYSGWEPTDSDDITGWTDTTKGGSA